MTLKEGFVWIHRRSRLATRIASVIGAISFVSLVVTRFLEWRVAAIKPHIFRAHITYLTSTESQAKSWREVQRHMLPVCVSDAAPCNVKQLTTQEHPADAEGQFLLVPVKDKTTGNYEYSGFGYYRESLRLKNQASLPIVWVVELHSVQRYSLGDIRRGHIEIPLAATQYGQGNTLPFTIKVKLGSDGTFEPEAPIFYEGTQIATVSNIRTEPPVSISTP